MTARRLGAYVLVAALGQLLVAAGLVVGPVSSAAASTVTPPIGTCVPDGVTANCRVPTLAPAASLDSYAAVEAPGCLAVSWSWETGLWLVAGSQWQWNDDEGWLRSFSGVGATVNGVPASSEVLCSGPGYPGGDRLSGPDAVVPANVPLSAPEPPAPTPTPSPSTTTVTVSAPAPTPSPTASSGVTTVRLDGDQWATVATALGAITLVATTGLIVRFRTRS